MPWLDISLILNCVYLQSFRQNNSPGIASVVIQQTDSNSIRMVVTYHQRPSSQIAQRNAQELPSALGISNGGFPHSPLPLTYIREYTSAKRLASTADLLGVEHLNLGKGLYGAKIQSSRSQSRSDDDGAPAPATDSTGESGSACVAQAIAPPVGDIARSRIAMPSTI